MTCCTDTFATAFGEFSIAVNATGALAATAFGPLSALRQRMPACQLKADRTPVRTARDQVLAYFAGDLRAFSLPLAPTGTAFQQNVWRALAEIPFGETRSYAQLAAAIGRPFAARAVGRANATNPICLVIPCHRVIGSDGSLTGFAFGTDIKRRLLTLENPRNIAWAA